MVKISTAEKNDRKEKKKAHQEQLKEALAGSLSAYARYVEADPSSLVKPHEQ